MTVVIGSCTNGRLEDNAEGLKGNKVSKYCRVIIIPATQKILGRLELGYIDTFIEAGCAVSAPPAAPA